MTDTQVAVLGVVGTIIVAVIGALGLYVARKTRGPVTIQELFNETRALREDLDKLQTKHDDLRTKYGELEEASRKKDNIVEMLRRIARRFTDAWPASALMPHLTPEEWALIGIDEDTIIPSVKE